MLFTAASIAAVEAASALIAVATTPVPRAFVRTSNSPASAEALVTRFSMTWEMRSGSHRDQPILGFRVVHRVASHDGHTGFAGDVGSAANDLFDQSVVQKGPGKRQ